VEAQVIDGLYKNIKCKHQMYSSVGVFLADCCTRSVPVSCLVAWSWSEVCFPRSSPCKRFLASIAEMPKRPRSAVRILFTLDPCSYGLAYSVSTPYNLMRATHGGHLVMAKTSLNSVMNCSTSARPVKEGASSLYFIFTQ